MVIVRAAALAWATTLAAWGVGAAQQPDTTRRDPAVVELDPVTVTAMRKDERLLDLPLAVTIVSRRALAGLRGAGLEQALGLVPGVIAASRAGGGDVRITIRGFGARGAGDRSNAGTTRGIRVLLDGFPETEPDGRTALDQIDLATVQSLEVVRSNASALWGNAAGGVVAVSTVPEAAGVWGAAEAETGAYGFGRAAVRGGTPLGAGKLSGAVTHTGFDGWRIHSAARRTLATASVVAPLDERTSLGVFAVATRNDFRIPGPLTAAQLRADPRQANAVYQARDERRENTLGRLGITLDHLWDGGRALALRAFVSPKMLHRSERGTYRDFTRYHVGGSAIFRTAVGSRGALQIGGDAALQDGAILFYSLTPAGGRGDTLRADKREGASNAGLFVQADFPLGARWDVALGARVDAIRYAYQDFLAPRLDAAKQFTGVTPKFGVSYRVGPGHRLYAAVGGGIEAPAGNETDPASTFGQDTVTAINPLLEPVRSTTYEVGTKRVLARSADGLLRTLAYDAALYWTEVRNEIVPYRGGRFYFTAGAARRRGAELGLALQLAGGLTLQGASAWFDHRYREYLVDSVHYGVPGATADYAGNRVVGIPRWVWSTSVGWAPRPLHPAAAGVALQGQSAYFADDANQVRVTGHTIVRLTLGLAAPIPLGSGVGLRVWAALDNALNRAYVASSFLNPDVVGGVPVAFEPGLPRTVTVGLAIGAER